MQSLTPSPIQLIDYVDDGELCRHFTFQLKNAGSLGAPQPGQFFMLHIPGCGAAPFTFTTPPNEHGVFHALIRRVGSLTESLFTCKPGTILGARGPFGIGWPIDQLAQQQLPSQQILIIAGGCGLAPLVSLIDGLLATKNAKNLSLIYGAASKRSQLLNPERQRWRQQMPVFDVVEEPGQSELTGTPIDVLDTVLEQCNQFPTALLLCGPEIMMRKAAEEFIRRGLEPAAIWLSIERRMHCGVGLCGHCYLQHEYACKNGPTYRWDQLQPLLEQSPEPAAPASPCY